CECTDAALNLACIMHVDWKNLDAERLRHCLNDAELADPGGVGSIPKDRHTCHVWCDLLEQLQPFTAHAVFESHETGNIATRPRQTIDEAGADGITYDRKHDRYGAGCLQQRPYGRGAMGQDDVGRERG